MTSRIVAVATLVTLALAVIMAGNFLPYDAPLLAR